MLYQIVMCNIVDVCRMLNVLGSTLSLLEAVFLALKVGDSGDCEYSIVLSALLIVCLNSVKKYLLLRP